MRHLSLLVCVVGLSAFFAGCGGGSDDSGTVASNSTPAAPAQPYMPPAGPPPGVTASSGAATTSPPGTVPGMSGMNAPATTSNASPPGTMPGMSGMPPGTTGATSGASTVPTGAVMYPTATTDGTNPAAATTPNSADYESLYGKPQPDGTANPAGTIPGTVNYGTPNGTVPNGAVPNGANPYAQPNGAGANPYGGQDIYGQNGNGQNAAPQTFADMAEQAFQRGDNRAAFQYLYAHALTAEPAAAKQLLDKMGYSSTLKRPLLAVRWAVGAEIKGAAQLLQNPYPIGVNQNIPTRKPRREGGGAQPGGADPAAIYGAGAGAMPGMAGGGQGGVSPELQRVAGELAQKLVTEFKERLDGGDFGKVLQPVAKPAGNNGGVGNIYGGADPAMMYAGANPGGGAANGPAVALARGVSFVGIDSEKKLIEKARDAEADVLLVFNISLTFNPKNSLTTNNTMILLIDPADGKDVFKTTALNNIAVQTERANQDDDEEDDVDKTIDKLFNYIDTHYRVGELATTIDPNLVRTSVGGMLKQTTENPLPTLAIVRMYNTRGLLDDNLTQVAYQRLLGDAPGLALATGSEDERKAALEKWLPKQ